MFVIRTLVKFAFAVATTGCLPGVVLSQVAASFSDPTTSATFSSSASFSGSADFSVSTANYYSSGSSNGAGRGGSALRRQTLRLGTYSPSTTSASPFYGAPSLAFLIQSSSSAPRTLNPSAPGRIVVSHAARSLSLGTLSLAQNESSDLPSSSSRSSSWSSSPDMSILKRLRGASVPSSTHSPRSQKFDRTQNTRSQELKSLMGISNQP